MKAGPSYQIDDTPYLGPRGRPADPGRLWLSLSRDWRWIPLAALIWGALGAAVAFLLTKNTFRSTAVLIWEPHSDHKPDEHEMAEAFQSLKLPDAMGKIGSELGLSFAPEMLAQQVHLRFEPHSKLVVVNADGASGTDAMWIGRTVTEAFFEQQRDLARKRARVSAVGLQKDAVSARSALGEAEQAYAAFRSTTQNVAPAEASAGPADAPASGKSKRKTARGEAGAKAARADTGTQRESAEEEMADSDVRALAQLRAELAQVQKEAPDSARAPALEGQIAALEARVARKGPQGRAVARVASPQSGPHKAHSTLWRFLSQRPGADGQGASDGQAGEGAMAERGALEAQDLALQKEVATRQARLADLERRLALAMGAAAAPEDDWRVLSPATLPTRPDRTKQDLIAGSMPLAGMLVALLALLLRPLADARVYTAREAGYWSKLPVLASSAWPKNREMFFPLVDELGQQAAGAPGYTLLVGATSAERALAEDLAYWLGGGPIGSRRAPMPSARVEAPPTVVSAPAQTPFVGVDVSGVAGPVVAQSDTLVLLEQRRPPGPGVYAKGIHAWLGEVEGPALRRAARLADRVIVLLGSGALSFAAVSGLPTRLGRTSGVGLVVLGLSPALLKLPDQAGEIGNFWRHLRRQVPIG